MFVPALAAQSLDKGDKARFQNVQPFLKCNEK